MTYEDVNDFYCLQTDAYSMRLRLRREDILLRLIPFNGYDN